MERVLTIQRQTVFSEDREELSSFITLQESLKIQFQNIFPDRLAARSIIVVPSLTLDPLMLEKLHGQIHYEERMLCLLMLLRMPHTQVIYLTSLPVDPVIIDYYLHLLPGITGSNAMKRLTMLSCNDPSARPLTKKLLEEKNLLRKIKELVPDHQSAHLVCFNVTFLEKKLALELGMPVYGCDPDLFWLGTKSGSRKVFQTVGVGCPEGRENIYTNGELVKALCELKEQRPLLQKAVIKLNNGFSGDGNAIFDYDFTVPGSNMEQMIAGKLTEAIRPVAGDLTSKLFLEKMELDGGIVEEFIEGKIKSSPSVQCRINPLGNIDIISTHDQLLSGEDRQVYEGASFPANRDYSRDLAILAKKIAGELAACGVLGRFSIDFISTFENGQWKHSAIEINLRKGGTTHPFLMLQFLTDGYYDPEEGKFFTASGHERCYFTTDNIVSETCRGMTPSELIDLAITHDLLYDGTKQEGVMFHMIGALRQFGKIGAVAIGRSPDIAREYFSKTLSVLHSAKKTP